MAKLSKKKIRQTIEDAIHRVLLKFDESSITKKTRKLVESSSKKIADLVKSKVKKKEKKAVKKQKPPMKVKAAKKTVKKETKN